MTQLIRENNQAGGFTQTWEYDNGGNITFRRKYAYTTGSLENLVPVQVHEMSGYGMYGMGDLFAEYDGQVMSYDAIGNPLNDGQWTYTWAHGRELVSMVDGDFTWEFTYDANGMRTRRTDGVMDYRYIYNGSQLSQLTVTDDWQQTHVLYFAYSADGTPLSVTYNGTTYYYVTNIQGDVVAILNAAGNAVVTYTYDAWGNPLTTAGTMASTLGMLNPLRYRGYVYDQETGLYYLQSRYYNPEWCRFLNADAYVSTGQGVLGNNMFAYCLNNPVNMIDTTGAMPKLIPPPMDSNPLWVDTPLGRLRYIKEFTKKGDLYEHWVDGEVPRWSRHHTDHDNPKEHPLVPHDHEWKDDDNGNNKPSKPKPPNPDYRAPDSKDNNSAKMVAGAIGTAATSYLVYLGVKWVIASLLAPVTAGGSLVAAGVTP